MADSLHKGKIATSMVILAIVAAIGIVGVVGVTILTTIQQAEAVQCRVKVDFGRGLELRPEIEPGVGVIVDNKPVECL